MTTDKSKSRQQNRIRLGGANNQKIFYNNIILLGTGTTENFLINYEIVI